MSEQRRPLDPPVDPSVSQSTPIPPRSETSSGQPAMFASKPPEGGGVPVAAWGVAGLVVLVVLLGLVFATRHKSQASPNTIQPLAAYAAELPLSQLAMSESTSLSGGKSTFIDGHIQNAGGQTVSGISVQVIFRNDEAMPPQVETLPLSVVRMREPYIDTQPISAAPLKPGEERDFRLIFETIPANWNTQMPEIHIISVDTK
ncbi:DUF2393 domain-containing protein [Tunturiibacter empetritectus]|uniref:DUF2393 domain-containing protein n=2 Tax=Tunturiibacter TaxID=3154218 RepID=A0A852VCW5_9BACT|nr:DUF2393 domain-containing protein [Edaphobacter lichenicola]NYF88115.1 hypothetical protein [Edaphobacter lichenicola]